MSNHITFFKDPVYINSNNIIYYIWFYDRISEKLTVNKGRLKSKVCPAIYPQLVGD